MRCAAIATFRHGKNIAGFAFDGAIGRPARPTQTMPVAGGAVRVSLIASCMLEMTRGMGSFGNDTAHGSPPDCCQTSACISLGSTLSAHAVTRVTRSMLVHSVGAADVHAAHRRLRRVAIGKREMSGSIAGEP